MAGFTLSATIKGVDQATAVFGRVARSVESVTRKFDGLRSAGRKMAAVGAQIGRQLTRIAKVGAVAFVGATAWVTALARKAVLAQGVLEKIQTMLTTAFGGAGGKAFAAAERFSIKTPFTPGEVATGAIFLKQLKVINSAGAELNKWMRLAGDMAGAMGKSFEDAVFAIGYGLQGESERLKQFGITARDLIGAGAQKAVSGLGVTTQTAEASAKFLGAMEKLISARFKGGAATLAKTLQGLWSTFKGLAQFMQADLAKAGGKATSLFGSVKRALTDLNAVLTDLRGSAAWATFTEEVSEGFGRIVDAASGVGKAFAEGKLREWLTAVAGKLEGFSTKVVAGAQAFAGLASAAGSLAAEKAPEWFGKFKDMLEAVIGMDVVAWSHNFELGFTRIEVAVLKVLRKITMLAAALGGVWLGLTGLTSLPAWAVAAGAVVGGGQIGEWQKQAEARVVELEAQGLKKPGPGARPLTSPRVQAMAGMPDFAGQYPRESKAVIRAMQATWEKSQRFSAAISAQGVAAAQPARPADTMLDFASQYPKESKTVIRAMEAVREKTERFSALLSAQSEAFGQTALADKVLASPGGLPPQEWLSKSQQAELRALQRAQEPRMDPGARAAQEERVRRDVLGHGVPRIEVHAIFENRGGDPIQERFEELVEDTIHYWEAKKTD